MVDPNEQEAAAMRAAGDIAGQYIDAVGRTDMATWSEQDWRGFIEAICGAYATALFGRYAENTAKLAMIAAVSRDPAQPVTQARDVTWAAQLVEHCIATLLREAEQRVSDNSIEANHKKLLAIIRDGRRLSRSEVTRRSQFLTRREREEILASLIEGGLIVVEQQASATRPATFYRAVATSKAPSIKGGGR